MKIRIHLNARELSEWEELAAILKQIGFPIVRQLADEIESDLDNFKDAENERNVTKTS